MVFGIAFESQQVAEMPARYINRGFVQDAAEGFIAGTG
jgi:hypothetical protein